ncbi:hypothetical protein SYNPS1DRAFT_28560 [Syncephalis pseudoplumigaleata]|uniref:BHLH domain-containing protein n=1 Tax=Syncephalis pseudoplumigaleata TaxID=1712513 RepID=A0A4P9YZW1_9FUNG|nr:hypothetical protein SYNPS1DRAFT_28560 [Syncephalis pseudoplumigaleata]|eukprot:RKP25717.1 hypothetical protein SYNPS1DRAFT_28560 [Syncephalis pseudoplumigaleata]
MSAEYDNLDLEEEMSSDNSRPTKVKRLNHNELERKRRHHQKEKLNELRDIIPTLQLEKPSTVLIMQKAKEYIDLLKKRLETVELENTPMSPTHYGYPPMPVHSPHVHGPQHPHFHQHPTPPHAHLPAEQNEAAMYQQMPPHANGHYHEMPQPASEMPTPGPSMQTLQLSNSRRPSIKNPSEVPAPSSTGKRQRRARSSSNVSPADAASASPTSSGKETLPPTPSSAPQPTPPPVAATETGTNAATSHEAASARSSLATTPLASSEPEASGAMVAATSAGPSAHDVKREADYEGQPAFLSPQPMLDAEHKKEPPKSMVEPSMDQDIVLLASNDAADSAFEPISMFRKRRSIVDVEYEDMKRSYFNRRNSTLMAMEANNEQFSSNATGASNNSNNPLPSSMLLPILPPPLGFEPLQQLTEEDVCCQVCKDGQSGLIMLDCDRCHSWFHGNQ